MCNDLYDRLQSFSVCIHTQECVDVKRDICKQVPCFTCFAYGCENLMLGFLVHHCYKSGWTGSFIS